MGALANPALEMVKRMRLRIKSRFQTRELVSGGLSKRSLLPRRYPSTVSRLKYFVQTRGIKNGRTAQCRRANRHDTTLY